MAKAAIFYDPAHVASFSTARKLRAALGGKQNLNDIQRWLQKQDAYTLHRPVRKNFLRNPYTVNNLLDVFECDLVDVQALAKYNDNHRYLLTIIDVFSKYLHIVPLKVKTGPAVTSAFLSIFKEPRYSKPLRKRPVWVRTDKGKEFLNKTFQDALKREGIRFQVCRNPDVKCSVVERAQRTIREKIYKYFTARNTYRFIDVLPKVVKSYNNTVHRTLAMAPSQVTESRVLEIWKRMREKQGRIRSVRPKFRVGQHVRISKEKMKFAKGAEQNYTTEIFRIIKVVPRKPRPVYELEDLNKTPIEGQFYGEELVLVRVSDRTVYKIDKILDRRRRRGILEYLVRWRGYTKDFDTWVPAASVRDV